MLTILFCEDLTLTYQFYVYFRPKKYRAMAKDLYTPASEGDVEKVFYLLSKSIEIKRGVSSGSRA